MYDTGDMWLKTFKGISKDYVYVGYILEPADEQGELLLQWYLVRITKDRHAIHQHTLMTPGRYTKRHLTNRSTDSADSADSRNHYLGNLDLNSNDNDN